MIKALKISVQLGLEIIIKYPICIGSYTDQWLSNTALSNRKRI